MWSQYTLSCPRNRLFSVSVQRLYEIYQFCQHILRLSKFFLRFHTVPFLCFFNQCVQHQKKKQRKKVICWDNQESERTKEPSKLLASVLIHPYSVPDGPVPLCDHCDTFSSLLPSYAASHFFVCLFVSIGKDRKEV